MADWPQPACAGVCGATGVTGVSGDASRRFEWASVTKLLTSTVVLVEADHGTVSLEEPAGPPGSTLRHLLAHASGLAPDDDRVLSPPGRRRIYSNRGMELAAGVVERATGRSFDDCLRQRLLDPLDMTDTVLEGSAASGASGPLSDLLRFAGELLRPTLLEPATLDAATRVNFEGLAGVLPGFGRQDPNDWGLGFELRDEKRPHWTGRRNSPATFGHFGRSGSFLWVDPAVGLACAGLASAEFGPWALRSWPALSDAVLDAFSGPRG
jgi:CubicO group peptidase (beta-lactamase class C family)